MIVWPLLFSLLAALLALLLLFLLVPIVLRIDSEERHGVITWLGVLSIEFRPLATRKVAITFAGRGLGRKPAEKARPRGPKKKRGKRKATPTLFLRLLADEKDVLALLLRRLRGFIVRLVHAASLRYVEGDISFPDPMCNGLLFVVLSELDLERLPLRLNFAGENRLTAEARLYPYKVSLAVMYLLVHFPYIRFYRLMRRWRKNY